MISSDSNLSLPYDEREDCYRKNNLPAQQNSLGETRRRSRATVPSDNVPIHQNGGGHSRYTKKSDQHLNHHHRGLPVGGSVYSARRRVVSNVEVHRHKLKRFCRRKLRKRHLKQHCLTLMGAIFLLAVYLVSDFYMDAVSTCAAPQSSSLLDDEQQQHQRPLVEYFVHGRGNGHYQRSRAIVAKLNEAGVDVRMFLDRATLWRAYYEDAPDQLVVHTTAGNNNNNHGNGTTTAIAVTTIAGDVGFFDSLSHTIERITGDCKAAFQTSRYPMLVVSDGDLPGMLRAKLGGIPSVGISHGQVFNIGQVPEWLPRHLYRAWKKQKRLNGFASLFSNWQIATNFLHLESRLSSGIVARPPLRQEVILMAQARNDPLHTPSIITERNLLGSLGSKLVPAHKGRRLVLCYFRDGNGEIVLEALLRAGFDVLTFGHNYQLNDNARSKPFGGKWIIHHHDHPDKADLQSAQHGRRLVQTQDEALPPQLIQVYNHSLFVPLMSIVDGVVSSAGSQLMSECIYMDLPLLAFYKESDDEQKLNAEMSRHRDPQKTRVFTSSFESFRAVSGEKGSVGLRGFSNQTSLAEEQPTSEPSSVESFANFVNTVRASKVSQSYFEAIAQNKTDSVPDNDTTVDQSLAQQYYEKVFPGMPDAAAIILEVIKQIQDQEEIP